MRPLFCVKEIKTSFVHLGRNPRKRKKHTKSKQKKAKKDNTFSKNLIKLKITIGEKKNPNLVVFGNIESKKLIIILKFTQRQNSKKKRRKIFKKQKHSSRPPPSPLSSPTISKRVCGPNSFGCHAPYCFLPANKRSVFE